MDPGIRCAETLLCSLRWGEPQEVGFPCAHIAAGVPGLDLDSTVRSNRSAAAEEVVGRCLHVGHSWDWKSGWAAAVAVAADEGAAVAELVTLEA